jgi:hypothetical protein
MKSAASRKYILIPSQMPQAPPRATLILKWYLMVQLIHKAYFFSERPHRACPPGGGHMAAERTAHATSFAPERRAAPSGSLREKPMAVAGR